MTDVVVRGGSVGGRGRGRGRGGGVGIIVGGAGIIGGGAPRGVVNGIGENGRGRARLQQQQHQHQQQQQPQQQQPPNQQQVQQHQQRREGLRGGPEQPGQPGTLNAYIIFNCGIEILGQKIKNNAHYLKILNFFFLQIA